MLLNINVIFVGNDRDSTLPNRTETEPRQPKGRDSRTEPNRDTGMPDFFERKAPNLKKVGTKRAPNFLGPFYCIFERFGRVNFSKFSEFAQDF